MNQSLKLNIALPGQPRNIVPVNGEVKQKVLFDKNDKRVKKLWDPCIVLARKIKTNLLEDSIKLGEMLIPVMNMVGDKAMEEMIQENEDISMGMAKQAVRLAIFKRGKKMYYDNLKSIGIQKLDAIAQQESAVQHAMLKQKTHKLPGADKAKTLQEMNIAEIYILASTFKSKPRFNKSSTIRSLKAGIVSETSRTKEAERNLKKFTIDEVEEIMLKKVEVAQKWEELLAARRKLG